jgi:hypothetical protein
MPLRRVSGIFKLAEKISPVTGRSRTSDCCPGPTGAVSFAVLVDGKPGHGLGVDLNNLGSVGHSI